MNGGSRHREVRTGEEGASQSVSQLSTRSSSVRRSSTPHKSPWASNGGHGFAALVVAAHPPEPPAR